MTARKKNEKLLSVENTHYIRIKLLGNKVVKNKKNRGFHLRWRCSGNECLH
jgi:hypothetical protein